MKLGEFTKKLRQYHKRLTTLNGNELNEADTVFHFGHFLSNVLGYDRMTDITREFAVRSTYCDYAIRINNKLKLLIEVKAMPVSLKETHLRQAASYAINAGVEWCLLSNGNDFQLYHIEFTKPVDMNLVFSVNVMNDDIKEVARNLYYLSKASFKKGEIKDYWAQINTLSDANLAKALLSEDVLKAARRVIKRDFGQNLELVKIGEAVGGLFDDSLNINISLKKIAKKKTSRKPKREAKESKTIDVVQNNKSVDAETALPAKEKKDESAYYN
jgi:hypothetical protein